MEKTILKDFTVEPIQVITLDDLKLSYHETNMNLQATHPVGVFHDELIERISMICDKHNVDHQLTEIFVGNNKEKKFPGVAISDTLSNQYGIGSVESHSFRRVFATFQINKLSDEETTTGLVIAYHQDGLQIAIGPNVRICKNQCILSPSRMVTSYGENKIKEVNKILDIVDDWLFNFEEHRIYDKKIISQMKEINCSYNNVMELIGRLNVMRVTNDSKDTNIRKRITGNYPLNQGQISLFTEAYLKECINRGTTDMTLWDIYNISTELYKPGKTDFPNILTQNISWAEFLIKEFNL